MKTVPTDADVTMTTTSDLSHRCPYVDEQDHGAITITWRTDGQTFELHALRAYLSAWSEVTASHEDVTDRIRHDLSTVPGVEVISVETTWLTASMEVRCSTSPIPVDRP